MKKIVSKSDIMFALGVLGWGVALMLMLWCYLFAVMAADLRDKSIMQSAEINELRGKLCIIRHCGRVIGVKQEILKEIGQCIKSYENRLQECATLFSISDDIKVKTMYLREWFRLRKRLGELREERLMIRRCTKDEY